MTTQVLQYAVGNAPSLRFQVTEPASESANNAPFVPDITAWQGQIRLVPREAGVPAITGQLYLADAANGIFGFDIAGGRLPLDPLPQVNPQDSFSLPATYDVAIDVHTAAGEYLTLQGLQIVVSPHP